MKLDTTLSSLIDDLLVDTQTEQPDQSSLWSAPAGGSSKSTSNLWNDTHSWVKLADLAEFETQHILTVRPRRRTYLSQADAGYDWAVGKEFVITTQSSPYHNQIVAVDEVQNLKRFGYTHLHIHYNRNSVPLEIEL